MCVKVREKECVCGRVRDIVKEKTVRKRERRIDRGGGREREGER